MTKNKTLTSSKINVKKMLGYSLKESDINASNFINKVLLGDCLSIIRKLPNNFIDLLIIDPPYNLTKKYSTTNFNKTNNEEYTKLFNKWIDKIKPKLKSTASIYVCSDWKTSQLIYPILNKNFLIKNRITWQREKGRGSKTNWKNNIEDIWFATVSEKYNFFPNKVLHRKKVIAPYKINGKPKDWIETKFGNYRDSYPSNLWSDITIPYWSMKENTDHPTQKPEKLIAKLILASSNENDIVFDCFLGSGTTAVVAKKLNRKFVGIEKEKKYVAYSIKRLIDAEINKEIQGYVDGVFWERNTLNEQEKFIKRK